MQQVICKRNGRYANRLGPVSMNQKCFQDLHWPYILAAPSNKTKYYTLLKLGQHGTVTKLWNHAHLIQSTLKCAGVVFKEVEIPSGPMYDTVLFPCNIHFYKTQTASSKYCFSFLLRPPFFRVLFVLHMFRNVFKSEKPTGYLQRPISFLKLYNT